jgi:hypothetical protein
LELFELLFVCDREELLKKVVVLHFWGFQKRYKEFLKIHNGCEVNFKVILPLFEVGILETPCGCFFWDRWDLRIAKERNWRGIQLTLGKLCGGVLSAMRSHCSVWTLPKLEAGSRP